MLDLVAVREGGTVADAIAISLRMAQHVESLGFTRYWLAEHHNIAGCACSTARKNKTCCLRHCLDSIVRLNISKWGKRLLPISLWVQRIAVFVYHGWSANVVYKLKDKNAQ